MQHLNWVILRTYSNGEPCSPARCLRQDGERAVCRGILLADWLLRHSVGTCMDAAALNKTQDEPHTDCAETRCVL